MTIREFPYTWFVHGFIGLFLLLYGGAAFGTGTQFDPDQVLDSFAKMQGKGVDSALVYINSKIDELEKGNDLCSAIELKIRKADLLDEQARYDESISTLKESIDSFHAACDSVLLLKVYEQLSSTYLSVRDYDKVDSLFNIVRANFDQDRLNTDAYFGLLINRVFLFFNAGEIDSALKLSYDIISLWNPAIDSIYLQKSLNNLGSIFGSLGRMDSAQHYFTEAFEIAKARNNMSDVVELLVNRATIHIDLGNHGRAIEMYREARNRARKKRDLRSLTEIEWNWAMAYEDLGNYDSAYTHLYEYIQLKDSLLNAEKIRAVAEVEHKYEAERRKREIEELRVQNLNSELQKTKAERTLNYFILGGIILLLLSIGLWWRMQHIRKTRREIEKERDRSDRLLLNILPEEIAEELKREGKYTARHHRQVSIMFADFKDFTQNSELMSPEELVDEIDYCFRAFDKICSDHSLEKIKTIGDCYMAASGLPVGTEYDARNMVQAALEMQEFLMSRKKTREGRGKIGFDMRIGIHSGPVVAGVVGSDKFSYDIWGDTVNTASRMESSGEVGRVNISQETYDLIKGYPEFRFEKRGKVYAKHKGEVEMYFVTEKTDQPRT